MLRRWFHLFIAFFFADIYDEIDWARPIEFLDKELNHAVRQTDHEPRGRRGRRNVDVLVKVFLKDGAEARVLIHVEVQGYKEEWFDRRMFILNTLLYSRNECPVASFALLTDPVADWRPESFEYSVFGTRASVQYRVKKLLDYAGHEEELAGDTNPFALMTLAHLKTLATQGKAESRQEWKLRILGYVYEQGLPAEQVTDLVRCLDMMMVTPPRMQAEFDRALKFQEERKTMPFLSHIERVAIRKGMQQGREEGVQQGMQQGMRAALLDVLNQRFGHDADALAEKLESVKALAALQKLHRCALAVPSLDEFVKLLGPEVS